MDQSFSLLFKMEFLSFKKCIYLVLLFNVGISYTCCFLKLQTVLQNVLCIHSERGGELLRRASVRHFADRKLCMCPPTVRIRA